MTDPTGCAPDIACVLDKARPQDVVTDPFPHLVVEDALPDALHRRLVDARPEFEHVAWRGRVPSNRRIPYSARRILEDPTLDPIWPAFCRRHIEPDVFSRVAALFRPHLDRWHPALARWLDDGHPRRPGLLDADGFDDRDMLVDARLELNTPVEGPPTSVRGPHLDLPNRLFSGLYYLRKPEDDTPGGELELFRFRGGTPSHATAYVVPGNLVEVARTVPYRANTLVLFANSPHAVHGVTPRAESPHTRSYVFLTAEIGHDLFGETEDNGGLHNAAMKS